MTTQTAYKLANLTGWVILLVIATHIAIDYAITQ